MKKVLGIFLIMYAGFSFAGNARNRPIESIPSEKIVAADTLSTRFSNVNWVDIVDTDNIPDQTRDLNIDEDLTNKNILIKLENLSEKEITVNGLAYMANGTKCGITQTNIVIKPHTTVQDYFMDKAEGLKCLDKVIDKANGRYGHMQLIDIGSKFDIHKYQQFTSGLFLYPLQIRVYYFSKGTVSRRIKNFYLIFATL